MPTVNPQAVNEIDFDVFTANKRSVIYIRHATSGQLVAFVAIGALLVGAIGWTKGEGQQVRKGEELGCVPSTASCCCVLLIVGCFASGSVLGTGISHMAAARSSLYSLRASSRKEIS